MNAQLLGHTSPSEHIGHLLLAEFDKQLVPMALGPWIGGFGVAGAA